MATKEKKVELNEESNEQVKIELLEKRIATLETALSKIATLTGYGNHLSEYGLKRWEPSKADMSKHS